VVVGECREVEKCGESLCDARKAPRAVYILVLELLALPGGVSLEV
jgi:hypothetical protein